MGDFHVCGLLNQVVAIRMDLRNTKKTRFEGDNKLGFG